MTRRIFSKLLKPMAMLGTVLSAGVVLAVPALAQAESQVETSQEIELSSDALEILCERSPLNSRCEGGAAESRGTNTRTDRVSPEEADPADAASDPAEAPVNDAPDELPGSSSSEPGNVNSRTDRVSPEETDPADAASDPAEAPVNDAPDELPGSSSSESGNINSRTDRIDPDETDPADAASDPAEAPVEDAPESNTGTVAPKQASETQTAPSSTTTPAAETPVEPGEATSTPASISEAELEKFAEAVPQLQAIERTTQQEVVQAIEESGISRERFGQLYQQQTSGAAIEPVPTSEEQQTFTQAYSSIQKIQQDAQSEREQVIEAQGLEPQRFDQILAAVLQDPALQQQVQNMMAQ